jgi:hypothetical protein
VLRTIEQAENGRAAHRNRVTRWSPSPRAHRTRVLAKERLRPAESRGKQTARPNQSRPSATAARLVATETAVLVGRCSLKLAAEAAFVKDGSVEPRHPTDGAARQRRRCGPATRTTTAQDLRSRHGTQAAPVLADCRASRQLDRLGFVEIAHCLRGENPDQQRLGFQFRVSGASPSATVRGTGQAATVAGSGLFAQLLAKLGIAKAPPQDFFGSAA